MALTDGGASLAGGSPELGAPASAWTGRGTLSLVLPLPWLLAFRSGTPGRS